VSVTTRQLLTFDILFDNDENLVAAYAEAFPPGHLHGSPVMIRRVNPSDWNEVKLLRLRALATDPMAFGSTFERESTYPDNLWAERAQRAAVAPDYATWVAVGTNDRLVGLVTVIPEADSLMVVAMWVEPEQRGSGLGGQLLDALLEWVRKAHPSTRVRLFVNPALGPAVRLYERRGFVFTGVEDPLPHSPSTAIKEMVLTDRRE